MLSINICNCSLPCRSMLLCLIFNLGFAHSEFLNDLKTVSFDTLQLNIIVCVSVWESLSQRMFQATFFPKMGLKFMMLEFNRKNLNHARRKEY